MEKRDTNKQYPGEFDVNLLVSISQNKEEMLDIFRVVSSQLGRTACLLYHSPMNIGLQAYVCISMIATLPVSAAMLNIYPRKLNESDHLLSFLVKHSELKSIR